MPYVPVHVNWEDDPSTATPILGADLEHMEAGIVEGARAASETVTGNVELASAAEMTAATDLTRVPSVKRVADYVTAQVGSGGVAAASETVSGTVELATSAEVSTGTDLTRVPSVKRIVDYVIAAVAASATTINASITSLSNTTTSALSGKADKSGSWSQFADVADLSYSDGDVPMADGGVLEPADLSSNFAGIDANLRLAPGNFPQYYVPTIVIEESDVPPGNFPNYGLVGKLPAAASVIPTLLDADSVRAANNIVLQFPELVPSGTYVGFTIGFDGALPIDHFTAVLGGTGAGTGAPNYGTISNPNTTAGVMNSFVRLTGAASAGSTLTITARDAADAAINRSHMMVAMYVMPNLITGTVRDLQVPNGGASNANLSAITAAATTNTAQPSELAIGSAVNSAGTAPDTRNIDGTGDWTELANILSDNGTNGRRLYVGYRALNAIGQPALTTVVSLNGTATQTGLWAAMLSTFRGL